MLPVTDARFVEVITVRAAPSQKGRCMLQSDEKELAPTTSNDLSNRIKQLLQYQHYAVHRATSLGMTHQEATEMEARIDQIGELVDRLHARLTNPVGIPLAYYPPDGSGRALLSASGSSRR